MQLKITKRDKFIDQKTCKLLIDDFINDSYAGRRLKANGTKISKGTISNYNYLKQNFDAFCDKNTFEVKIYVFNNLTQKEKESANRYYKKFYQAFTSFLYNEKNYFDNYVGLIIKCLRSFFNYLEKDRSVSIGAFHKSFYIPVEEIPIIALSHEQLNFLIFNKEFNTLIIAKNLEKAKDIFVFGCTVALRVSDLLSLTKKNLQVKGDKYYIQVKSQKTNTHTSIKLPDYAVDILEKHKSKKANLLPSVSSAWFNTQLKELSMYIPDNFEIIKTRERRGKQVIVYRDPIKKTHYKLSDHISTHTMRRTAITNMLCLGMPEHLVRKISGHAANSKEFFRYVKLSQSFIDDETDRFFDQIKVLD
jgi:integrase